MSGTARKSSAWSIAGVNILASFLMRQRCGSPASSGGLVEVSAAATDDADADGVREGERQCGDYPVEILHVCDHYGYVTHRDLTKLRPAETTLDGRGRRAWIYSM